jgi:hypothetical protein
VAAGAAHLGVKEVVGQTLGARRVEAELRGAVRQRVPQVVD